MSAVQGHGPGDVGGVFVLILEVFNIPYGDIGFFN